MRWAFLLAPLLMASSSGLCAAGPAVSLPPTVAGEPGDFVVVKAETTSPVVQWFSIDKELRLFPIEMLRDTKAAVVIGRTPGRFRLLAWVAEGNIPSPAAVCVVVIGEPGPGPGPPPLPLPVPPEPPIPPEPSDPFRNVLQAAFSADTTPDKGNSKGLLAVLFRQAATTAKDPAVVTVGDLFTTIKKASQSLVTDAVPKTRAVLNAEIARTLPAQANLPLDADLRRRASDLFARLAVALEGLR